MFTFLQNILISANMSNAKCNMRKHICSNKKSYTETPITYSYQMQSLNYVLIDVLYWQSCKQYGVRFSVPKLYIIHSGGSSNDAVVLQYHKYFCYFYKKTFVKNFTKKLLYKSFIKHLKNFFLFFLRWFSLVIFYSNSIFDF